jgi:3alpha(or 20beta)-hydroxysteroid dehydrogenase
MIGQQTVGAYAASKWGLRGLTRVAALELGPRGVRVNSVHPGGMCTPMGRGNLSMETINKSYTSIPLGRIGQPEEIAFAALFLASDESSYVCGAELLVDGGMIAGRR